MVELQALQQFPYFHGLDEERLRQLASITDRKTIPAGTQIFVEGEDADILYVIVRGKVEIRYPLGEDKHVGIQTLTRDDLLVWSALIEPYKTTSEGVATEETLVLAIDAKVLRDFFDTDPALGLSLMEQVAKMLARRMETARAKFAQLAESLDEILRHSRD
jgi:CRP-like cAMP-binding protein